MKQLKKTILTLVALLALTMHAWAQEQSETIATTASTVEGTHFTISNNGKYADGDGMYALGGITVTPKNGETITKVVISNIYDSDKVNDGNTSVSSGTKEITNGGGTITVTGLNASTFTFTCSEDGPQFGQFVVYYTEAPTATPVPLTRGTGEKINEWTLTNGMPAGNVTVSVEYWPYATLATNGVTAPTTYVWAKTEDPLAVVADGAVTGGTLMFAFGTETTYPDLDGDDWQTAIPTAENLDGAGGTTYVWFYIKGDDEHSDTEPRRLTIHVQPEPEYTVSMAEGTDDAAKWKAGKGTDEPAAFPLEGVKKGDKVTVTYEGLRKVIGVKAEKIVKIKTFSIQGPSGNVSPGQTITFTIINIQPAEATNQTFEWKLVSGTPEGTTIESISDDTKTVTVKAGSSMGPITIRATAKDGSGKNNTKQVWLIP